MAFVTVVETCYIVARHPLDNRHEFMIIMINLHENDKNHKDTKQNDDDGDDDDDDDDFDDMVWYGMI